MLNNKEKRQEKKRKRFIKETVNEAILNIRKLQRETDKKAIISPCRAKEWPMIKENLDEINNILLEHNIRIEIEHSNLNKNEIRIVNLA